MIQAGWDGGLNYETGGFNELAGFFFIKLICKGGQNSSARVSSRDRPGVRLLEHRAGIS